ncbi:hypothetical protein [Pseudomonas sp. NPDC096950]|uniref:hypothetical protein n=1 Tax=Pseudomonas sp. NPDC096950 TaxID=3364485 RepID=UPI00383B1710
MSEVTEYSMTPEQALFLSKVAQAHLQERRALFRSYAATQGYEGLLDLFAQFVGMANSVAENCREMTDLVLITEMGMNPDKFDSINLPTLHGACQGVMLAARCDPTGACHGCAYRLGSIANQSPMATSEAAYMSFDKKGFMCHAELDEALIPTKVCVGHARAFKADAGNHDLPIDLC